MAGVLHFRWNPEAFKKIPLCGLIFFCALMGARAQEETQGIYKIYQQWIGSERYRSNGLLEIYVYNASQEPMDIDVPEQKGIETGRWIRVVTEKRVMPGRSGLIRIKYKYVPNIKLENIVLINRKKMVLQAPPLADAPCSVLFPACSQDGSVLTFGLKLKPSAEQGQGNLVFRVNDKPIEQVSLLPLQNASIDAFCKLVPATPMRHGQPVIVSVENQEGKILGKWCGRFAGEILIDSYGGKRDYASLRDYGFSPKGVVVDCELDITCADSVNVGKSASEVILAQKDKEARLQTIYMCTGALPDIHYAYYDGISDLVYLNPYSHYTSKVERLNRMVPSEMPQDTIDAETYFLCGAQANFKSSAWGYTPEAFFAARGYLPSWEWEFLVWYAIGCGAKGVKYFCMDNVELTDRPQLFGFRQDLKADRIIRMINKKLRTYENRLLQAVPCSRSLSTSAGSVAVCHVLMLNENEMMLVVQDKRLVGQKGQVPVGKEVFRLPSVSNRPLGGAADIETMETLKIAEDNTISLTMDRHTRLILVKIKEEQK